MKKLKSILAMALAFCICFSMTACSSSGEKTEADIERELETINEDNWEEKLMELDESMKEEKEKENNTGGTDTETITPTDEILSADIYSSKFQINNTVITFPATAAQLQEAGVIFSKDPETTVVKAGESSGSIEMTANGETESGLFFNKTEEAQLLKDCIILRPDFQKIILPKGVTVGTSVDELISKWGEPTVNNIDEYIYVEDEIGYTFNISDYPTSATGNIYHIYIDLETNSVRRISIFECNPESDEMIEKFNENDKVSYKIPDAINDGYMVYTYNGIDYLLNIASNKDFLFGNKGKMNLSELSDSAITEYYDKKATKQNNDHDNNYSYNYKLTNSAAIVIERQLSGEACEAVTLSYIDSEFNRYEVHCAIRQPKEEGWYIPEEALDAANDILFAIGETVKPSGE